MSTYAPAVRATGTVAFDGDRSTQVLAPISGPVTRIVVQPGAAVQRGQPLAYVSSPDFAAAVAAYRKAAARGARNAQRVADLDAQLFKNDAIARRDLEQAQTDAVSAAADRDAAAAAAARAGRRRRQHRRLQATAPAPRRRARSARRSPARVVERLINPGQLLQAGTTPCFTIADLSQVWVMANVFEADLARGAGRRRGRRSRRRRSPRPLTGQVDYIAALVDPSTKAAAVRVSSPNPQAAAQARHVRAGEHPLAPVERSGILVPVSAVLRDDDNLPFVFVDAAGGHFARRDVTLGARVGDQYESPSGLAPGDHIVTEGGLFLQFAQSQ